MKQLQQFYNKLNLMQNLDAGQQQPPHSTAASSSTSKLNSFTESMLLFHQQQQQLQQNFQQEKFSHQSSLLSSSNHSLIHNNNDSISTSNGNDNLSSSMKGNDNNKSEIKIDNITYVKDLFHNKVMNVKSSSRRPLSSWKQSINACGPGPAPWIEKSTLHSLGIQVVVIHSLLKEMKKIDEKIFHLSN
ncbi:hypothetical protein BLA29_007152 [Euroglyphus maynei]|uniref:Uncharacterized protein n=1 Tax=Euroglyphus maynei TaxID=6958 RepID=A0A1Y3B2H0_EURMA|nr:hypothetical protein BLA29_007152 [Euroglyphus maynei]